MRKILEKVRNFILNNALIEPVGRTVIGLSGGADSVCLFLILRQLGYELYPVHINHGIRGAEADRDEAFVEALCKKHGVKLTVFHEDIPAYAKERGLSEEEAGRIIRYRRFEEVKCAENADKIAVAHNADDKAETLLFNLVRGTSLKGAASIRPVRDNIVRPILCLSRAEIEEYLADINQEFVTDSTNLRDEYSRNKIRLSALPALKEVNEKASEHLADFAEEAAEIESFLEKEALKLFDECAYVSEDEDRVSINLETFASAAELLKKRVLYAALIRVTGTAKDITKTHVADMLALSCAETGKMASLPYGVAARKQYNQLIIEKQDAEDKKIDGEAALNIPGETVYKGCHFTAEIMQNNLSSIEKNDYTKYLDYDKIKGKLVLRSPNNGDYISIKGGSKKLSRIFVDAKVARENREKAVVLAAGAEIIWAVGYRIGEQYKVTDKTERILKISANF